MPNLADLDPLFQDLLLIVYKTRENYEQAVDRHPVEPSILLYNRMLGEPTIAYTVALELGMILVKEEPLDLDGYLYSTLRDYLILSMSQVPQEIDGYSVSLSQAITMTPEQWSEFIALYHPDTNSDYTERLDFVMSAYYLQEEKSLEALGEVTPDTTLYQWSKTMNEERQDVA